MRHALKITNLEKTYKGGTIALSNVNMSVKEGDFFALLGPNGAGKTTIIGIICSLVNKSSGSVHVFNTDIDEDLNQVRKYLGVVPQEFNFNIFEQVQQIVVNQAGYYGIRRNEAVHRSAAVLKQLGLWEKRHAQAQALSGGMKRRLMIARALIHKPRILILDEPTAGVDIELRRSMWDFLIDLNKSGTTIILTTHYLEEAEQLCRNIAIINNGKVLRQSTMKKLLSHLDKETFVVQASRSIKIIKKIKGYDLRQIDSLNLEVDVKRGQHLTKLISNLSRQGIVVSSIRNRANRLEETFINLIENSKTK